MAADLQMREDSASKRKSRVVAGMRPPAYPSKATLAAELDVSESTVEAWVVRGILPQPIRMGGSVRWCWADVVASLTSLSGRAPDEFMARIDNVS